MAKLAIEGMKFYAFHGFYEAERKVGGYYTVNVIAEIDNNAGQRDDLETTLNYEKVYVITKEIMKVSSKLIEHLAHQILNKLREKFPAVSSFSVKIIKHRPPLAGEVASTWFEIGG